MNIIDIFNLQNPWRKNTKFKAEPYFPRDIFPQILKWLTEPEIIVLIGPRQSGKTTIMNKLIEYLLQQKVPANSIFFFNCDNLAIQSFFNSIPDFIRFLSQMNSNKESIVLIDELQRLPNPGLFLKEIFDLKRKIKLIVSGSSSLEIKSKIKETLTGRKKVFTILPFNFIEFIQSENNYKELLIQSPKDIIKNYSYFEKIWGPKLNSDLFQFLTYGGYPRILQTTDLEKKKNILNEIFTSYVQRDVSDFLKIENISGFNKLVQMIALTSGQVINKSDLSLKSGLAINTLDKYLQILQDTFIIDRVVPYFSNRMKEIVKNPKFYFFDPGLRNFALSNFQHPDQRYDKGFLYETFIFQELLELRQDNSKLKFWRTKVGAEIDFILDWQIKTVPIECKSTMKKPVLSRSYQNFLNFYKPSNGFVLTSDFFLTKNYNATKIIFVPYYWFPFIKNEILN